MNCCIKNNEIYNTAVNLKKNGKYIDLTDKFRSAVAAALYLHQLDNFDNDIGCFIYEKIIFKLIGKYYVSQ